MMLALAGLAGLAAFAYFAQQKQAPALPSGSVAPPAAPLRSGQQTVNGRVYFVEVFAGNLARVTGQAAPGSIRPNPAVRRFEVLSKSGQTEPINILIQTIPQPNF